MISMSFPDGGSVSIKEVIKGPDLEEHSKLLPFFVAELSKPQDASKIMRTLNSELRLSEEFRHLRRIKKEVIEIDSDSVSTIEKDMNKQEDPGNTGKNEKNTSKKNIRLFILLCQKHQESKLSALLQGPLQSFQLSPVIINVPKYAALTLEEFHEKRKRGSWPEIFKRSPPRNVLKIDELPIVYKYMRLALKEATISADRGDVGVGAVLVNTERDIAVFSSGATQNVHPLQHAAMCCIEGVASKQREEDAIQGARRSRKSTKSELLESKNSVSTNNVVSNVNDNNPTPKKNIASNKNITSTCPQYLCTGFDAYLTHEPCTMCAMALVHSRVKRVFYGTSNLSAGGLGSCYSLHEISELNHHFQVYKLSGGSILEDCQRLLNKK